MTRFVTTFVVRKQSAFQRVQFDARMSLLCKKNVSDVFFRVHRVRERERERERENIVPTSHGHLQQREKQIEERR